MATTVLGLKTFAASDPVDYNEVNDNYNKIDNGVKMALQGRSAHNLLDNSDFRNPVNQRGKTSYGADGYTIDRWYFYNPNGDGTVTINNGYISLTGGSGAVSLSCRIPKGFLDANKTYTARICDNLGNINPTTLTFYDSFDAFEFSAGAGETKNVAWAALYEGSYTADTLPAYQPKGYAAELAACQRYYENSWFGVGKTATQEYFANVWSSTQADARIEFKQQKRISPTITFYPIGTESNWKIFNNGYKFVDSVENKGRGGLSGFIARVTKGSSDSTTWTVGYTIQAQGHWEASADL